MNIKGTMLSLITAILSQIAGLVISFFLSPYIVRQISEAAYGFVSLSTSFVSYASIITIALHSMANRYIAIKMHQADYKGANVYFNSAFIASAALAFVFLVIGVTTVIFLDQIIDIPYSIVRDVKMLFLFTFLSFVISTLFSVFGVCYFAVSKLYISNVRTLHTQVLRIVILAFLFIFYEPKVMYIGAASLIITIYTTVYNLVYTRRLLPSIRLNWNFFRWRAIKELVSSGIWNSINSLGTVLTDGLDLLFSNLFVGPIAMGALAISKTVPTTLRMLQSTIAGVFSPELTREYAKGDSSAIQNNLHISFKLIRLIMNVLIGCFIGFGIPFFRLWMPTQNEYYLFLLALLSVLDLVFTTSTCSVYNIFVAANKLKLPSLTHVLGGFLNTGVVLFLLNTTSLGVYAIVSVGSIIGILKAYFIILPYAASILHLEKYSFVRIALKSFWSFVAIALPGFVLTQVIVIERWSDFFIYGFLYGMISLGVMAFRTYGKKQIVIFIKEIINKYCREKR